MPLASPSIVRIPIAPAGMINAFLICQDPCYILVDSGLPGTEDKVGRALERLGKSYSDISLIIITHAHIDHAGNAALLSQRSGAPILAHEADLPYYLGEKKMTFCATGWFGHTFKLTGAIQKPYQPFTPDILLTGDQSYCLKEYGIEGYVRPTTGHTCGSISVIIEDKVALVGDLISSGILLGGILFKGKAKRPPFEENPQAVGMALEALTDTGVTEFHMGHGGPLQRREVRRHARMLRSLKR